MYFGVRVPSMSVDGCLSLMWADAFKTSKYLQNPKVHVAIWYIIYHIATWTLGFRV